jgi:hypothetical protein
MLKNHMKHLLLMLAFIPLTTFGQKTDSIKAKRISLGLTFSPDYCYRTLKPDKTKMSELIANERDSFEIPRFGYTTGINFAYMINKRFTLETGLLFSDKGEKAKNDTLIWNTSSGTTDPSLPIRMSFIYHYFYVDIPIKINFNLLTKRAKLYITAGISPNIYITQKTTSILEYDDGHTTKNSTTSRNLTFINLAVIGGLGFSYDLTEHLYFKIEPTYRRSITSIISAPIKGYLYSIGLNTGIYYKL